MSWYLSSTFGYVHDESRITLTKNNVADFMTAINKRTGYRVVSVWPVIMSVYSKGKYEHVSGYRFGVHRDGMKPTLNFFDFEIGHTYSGSLGL